MGSLKCSAKIHSSLGCSVFKVNQLQAVDYYIFKLNRYSPSILYLTSSGKKEILVLKPSLFLWQKMLKFRCELTYVWFWSRVSRDKMTLTLLEVSRVAVVASVLEHEQHSLYPWEHNRNVMHPVAARLEWALSFIPCCFLVLKVDCFYLYLWWMWGEVTCFCSGDDCCKSQSLSSLCGQKKRNKCLFLSERL